MAKDILDAIRAAEAECGAREAQAKTDAQQRNAQAKKDAAALMESREQAARDKCALSLAQTKKEAERELAEAHASARQQCAEISAHAEKKTRKSHPRRRGNAVKVTELQAFICISQPTSMKKCGEAIWQKQT